jgi:hypothetical protein
MIFRIYIALNMLLASLLPAARTRSSVSGYIGERALRYDRVANQRLNNPFPGAGEITYKELFPHKVPKSLRLANWLAIYIDKVHYWEPNHCRVTFGQEQQCRAILYHDREHRQ